MERPLSIEQIGVEALEQVRGGYNGAIERLSQMLGEAKSRVANSISYILDPPYNTPDGKPLEFHWYSQEEIAELNRKTEIGKALEAFSRQIEAKKQNGGMPRQYHDLFKDKT